MNVGVTGNFLSGKTTFSQMLSQVLNYEYFNCDHFVHELYKKETIQKIIVDNFGKNLYKGNEIQKNELAEIVFGSKKCLRKLESIVHPFVESEVIERVKDHSKDHLFEVPLLFETKINQWMDVCILVVCDKQICLQRAPQRNITAQEFEKRIQFQMNDEDRKKKNPIIVQNEGQLEDLEREVQRVAKIITN